MIISYALGYIYTSGQEQGIVKSGLIYLSTAPPGASVYLGNRRYTKKTPAALTGLIPGDYPVKLVLKKHKTWAGTLPVEAGKATLLERILLLPEQRKRSILSSERFEDLIPMPRNRFFILAKGSKTEDLFVYDWKEEKIRSLLPAGSPFRTGELVSHFSIEESPNFLLQIDSAGGKKFLWITPKTKETLVRDLTGLFPEEPENVEWHPQDKKHLFAFQNGYLNRLNIVSGTVIPEFLQNVRGYGLGRGLFDKKVYVLTKDFLFKRVDFEKKKEELLLDDPVLGQSLFGEEGVYQIKVFSDEAIFFLGEEGKLLANRSPYRFVEEGVLGLEFYPKLKRVLLWKKDALGVLDFSKENNGENVFESSAKLVWVFKQGKRIEQAFWVYEGSYILFRDDNKIFLLELETYGKPHLYELLEVRHDSSIFYSEESGELYYLDPVSGNLSSMEILPRREILLLPFPERKEEKKKIEIGEL